MSETDRADNSPPLLRLANVSRRYPDGAIEALKDVSLDIAAGQYLAIMGPSGSGKSTLLNLLGGLDVPTAGEVFFAGRSLAETNLDTLRSRHVGFVFQSFYLLPTLTALQNVQVPMFARSLSDRAREQKARQLLEAVGLMQRAKHLPARLSVGERQRVAIARALANDPQVLLADEPTGNLDTRSGAEVLDLFDRLHRQRQTTLVVITHSLEVARRADRIVWICDGQIAELPQEYSQLWEARH